MHGSGTNHWEIGISAKPVAGTEVVSQNLISVNTFRFKIIVFNSTVVAFMVFLVVKDYHRICKHIFTVIPHVFIM